MIRSLSYAYEHVLIRSLKPNTAMVCPRWHKSIELHLRGKKLAACAASKLDSIMAQPTVVHVEPGWYSH
jgi:hypothetical protein